MARREKHRRAERWRRAGFVLDESMQPAPERRDPLTEPSAYASAILRGLQGKHVYTGPVPDHRMRGRRLSEEIIAHRRVRGRIAKRSRKRNRDKRKRGNLVPLLWLHIAMLIAGGAAGLSTAPDAQALTYGAPLQVTVTWAGGDCWTRAGTKPDDHDPRALGAFMVPGCSDSATDTQFVTPGEWFGVDPDIGDAYAVACTVVNTANGTIVATDYARHGDGHNATCLGRWA